MGQSEITGKGLDHAAVELREPINQYRINQFEKSLRTIVSKAAMKILTAYYVDAFTMTR